MGYIDPSAIYKDHSTHWSEFWHDDLSIWENMSNLVNDCILLPSHSIQAPIVTAYSLVNQKWAKAMPILFLYGVSGSAKTKIIDLNKGLHQVGEIQGPECTFVSLRNEISRQYWIDKESGFVRDGAMLLFDNAWERTFLGDDKLLAMILRSYERANASITVSSSSTFGENVSYTTFSSKIISSVALFQNPRLKEIHRRLLIIRLKKLSEFTPEELAQASDFEPLDLDSVDFEGFYSVYFNFWNQEDVCLKYAKTRAFLVDRRHRVRQKILEKYPFYTEERFKVTIDLIATMVVSGGYETVWSAIDALAAFYEFSDSQFNSRSTIEEVVREFIETSKINQKILGGDEGINPKALKAYVLKSIELGVIPEEYKRDTNLIEVMQSLGYSLTRNGWISV